MVSRVVADLTAGLPTVGSRELKWAQDMIYNIITTLSLILTSIPPPPPRATLASARTRVWQRESARRYLPGHIAHVPASSACPSVPVSSACPGVPASLASTGVPASLASTGVPVSSRVQSSPASSTCPSVPASSASSRVPALSACPDTSASSPVPALSPVPTSLPVPALLACPNTSASLASLHVPASFARPGVPASSACPNTSASLARSCVPALSACQHAPASSHHVCAGRGISRYARTDARAWPLGDIGAKKGPCGASTDPTTGNAATDRAGRDTGNHTIPNGGRANNPCEGISQGVAHPTRHVGAGSNISCKAKQVCDRAPGRDGRQHGQDGYDLAASVNGSFATTYAEDRDGNSRTYSFSLFSRRTRRKCRMNNDIQRAATDAARHYMSNTRRT